ncbi:MAG: multiheme c-type cytochrome [Pseudomonadota bacterium]
MPDRSRSLLKTLPLLVALITVGVWFATGHRAVSPVAEPPPDAVGEDPMSRASAATTAEAPTLIRLACDADWRVRAAAFAALDRMHKFDRLPARDTPMAEREVLLVDWMEGYAAAIGHDLCDIFAFAPTAQFGTTLVDNCLSCHAGPRPSTQFAADGCVDCHAATHREWAGSAHANSLTHLVLPTVDPVSRKQHLHDFAGRRGLSCTACHVPAGKHDTCVAEFAARSCSDCHADAAAQWQAWAAAARPRKAVWPPGSVATEAGGAPASCVDCHMPDQSHAWSARRNPALLAQGLDIALGRGRDGRATIALTNLAGHDYPTGSTRRAIEVWVALDGAKAYRLTTLAPPAASQDTAASEPALRPAEQRVWPLPGEPERVTCRVVYVRDRFNPKSYKIDIVTATRHIPPTR